jgi:site-specific recombinase XerD
MRLLHAGTDLSVIALWLGHEQTETSGIYLHELSGIASGGREAAGQQVK